MKYFFALAFILLAGCSTPTEPMSPFSPGGMYYVSPGTFTGTWCLSYTDTLTNPYSIITDTTPCTAVITEADSLIVGTITNDSTKEALTLNGVHSVVIDGGIIAPLHDYDAYVKSSFGNSGLFAGDTSDLPIGFYPSGDTLQLSGVSGSGQLGNPSFSITCIRNR